MLVNLKRIKIPQSIYLPHKGWEPEINGRRTISKFTNIETKQNTPKQPVDHRRNHEENQETTLHENTTQLQNCVTQSKSHELWLKALAALAGDLGLVPRTHVEWFTAACNSISKDPMLSSGFHRTPHAQGTQQVNRHTHINIRINF